LFFFAITDLPISGREMDKIAISGLSKSNLIRSLLYVDEYPYKKDFIIFSLPSLIG
jgi:hypothetical protein